MNHGEDFCIKSLFGYVSIRSPMRLGFRTDLHSSNDYFGPGADHNTGSIDADGDNSRTDDNAYYHSTGYDNLDTCSERGSDDYYFDGNSNRGVREYSRL